MAGNTIQSKNAVFCKARQPAHASIFMKKRTTMNEIHTFRTSLYNFCEKEAHHRRSSCVEHATSGNSRRNCANRLPFANAAVKPVGKTAMLSTRSGTWGRTHNEQNTVTIGRKRPTACCEQAARDPGDPSGFH